MESYQSPSILMQNPPSKRVPKKTLPESVLKLGKISLYHFLEYTNIIIKKKNEKGKEKKRGKKNQSTLPLKKAREILKTAENEMKNKTKSKQSRVLRLPCELSPGRDAPPRSFPFFPCALARRPRRPHSPTRRRAGASRLLPPGARGGPPPWRHPPRGPWRRLPRLWRRPWRRNREP